MKTLLVLISLAVFAKASLQVRLANENQPPGLTIAQLEEQKWSPDLYKTFSFGHLQPWIDWVWIEFLADPSLKYIEAGKRSNAYFRTDLVTELDPLFYEAYYVGGLLSTIVRRDYQGALSLLHKGEEFRLKMLPSFSPRFIDTYWKEQWRIPFQLAYLYLFEFPDFEKAGLMFRNASLIKGSPPYFESVGENLKTPEGQFVVAARVMNYLVQSRTDERELERYREIQKSVSLGAFLYECEKKALKKNSRRLSLGLEKVSECRLDPLGGMISAGEDGRLRTTTVYDRVKGLRY